MQRQKIRPSFAEMQADFDQSDGAGSDDGGPEYAPAATPYRGVPPPVIASSSSSTAQGKSSSAIGKVSTQPKFVRIAPSSSVEVHEIESRASQSNFASGSTQRSTRSTRVDGPERFRFTFDEEKEDVGQASAEGKSSQRPAPLIGAIQERNGLNSGPASKSAERKSLSRFAQSRKEEKKGQAANFDTVTQDEWLDEDGEPMSAFLRSRLIQQGKGPPGTAGKRVAQTLSSPESAVKGITSTDLADPLLKAISQENEAKVSSMSTEEMQQSLKELNDTFGADLLEKLKRRKEGKRKASLKKSVQGITQPVEPLVTQQNKTKELTAQEIRSTFFPSEPKELPSSLQWTQDVDEDNWRDTRYTLRFDFSGILLEEGTTKDQDTRSAGLHHHGDEQERAGYSLEELLHLARSTLPSQCVIALQTLERVFTRYTILQDAPTDSMDARVVRFLADEHIRGKAAVIASWYIEDRQVSVRSAALRLLDVCPFGDVLQALSLLTKGQEKAALNLINVILPVKGDSAVSSHLLTLSPFINEMLRTASHHQSNAEDESVDPLSGIELWNSTSTGLPLRPDWPFIALDDLLHSGNCASLNRKNALSTSWDANERQIVMASLDLGLQMWTKVMQVSPHCTNILPSYAEVHLAIFKVFMLEEDQSQGGKATGLITGSDLFRDKRIAELLAGLFDLAKQLNQLSNARKDDMEMVATRHFGSSLPFYQLYTNFLGLYDSISFGMELFGRTALLAQSNQYASDYRRLLWIDYGHCLASMQTTLLENPFTSLKHYICFDSKDDGILQAMVNVLMRKTITKTRNELLFHIAVQQIGQVMWYTKDDSRQRVAKALFGANADMAEVQAAIEQYGIPERDESQKEQEKRREWLATVA
jgi:hypothetical protein